MTRQLILSLCALILASVANAQSPPWSPIVTHDVTYFHNGTAPSQGIYIDSTTVSGDTLHHYTRPLLFAVGNEPYENCEFEFLEAYDTLYVYNYSFLGSEVLELPNSQWGVINGDTSLLDMSANVGETWNFQSTDTEPIQATLVSAEAGLVLGVEDSIKTIALSSGDSILISRNHGLVYWPATDTTAGFSLIGITLEELGNHPPSPREIFDFQVGDVFCYWSSIDYGNVRYGPSRIEVLEKNQPSSDSLIYTVYREYSVTSVIPPIGSLITGSSADTLELIFNLNNFYIASITVPYRSIAKEININEVNAFSNLSLNAFEDYYFEDFGRNTPLIKVDNIGSPSLAKGIDLSFNEEIIENAQLYSTGNFGSQSYLYFQLSSSPDDSEFSLNDTVKIELCNYSQPSHSSYSWSPGLGFTSLSFQGWMLSYESLIGFTNGTDTLGYVPPPGVLSTLSTNQRTGMPKLNVYPNPATEYIQIEGLLDRVYHVDIYSASGVLVLQESINTNAQLNVKSLPQGMYYGTAQTPAGDRAVFQFMVQ